MLKDDCFPELGLSTQSLTALVVLIFPTNGGHPNQEIFHVSKVNGAL